MASSKTDTTHRSPSVGTHTSAGDLQPFLPFVLLLLAVVGAFHAWAPRHLPPIHDTSHRVASASIGRALQSRNLEGGTVRRVTNFLGSGIGRRRTTTTRTECCSSSRGEGGCHAWRAGSSGPGATTGGAGLRSSLPSSGFLPTSSALGRISVYLTRPDLGACAAGAAR